MVYAAARAAKKQSPSSPIFASIILTAKQIAEQAIQLRPSVINWIPVSPGQGKEWKQRFKNAFVYETQFAVPGKQQKFWKDDLQAAALKTVKECCPNWKCDCDQKVTYQEIQTLLHNTSTRSPRQEWLFEKACWWLQSLLPDKHVSAWYPHQAIPVAHELFFSGRGKFNVFVKKLKKRRELSIKQLIQAYESIAAVPARSCYQVLPLPSSNIVIGKGNTSTESGQNKH